MGHKIKLESNGFEFGLNSHLFFSVRSLTDTVPCALGETAHDQSFPTVSTTSCGDE